MNKNKRIALVSAGFIVVLISGVLLIRSPNTSDPPITKEIVETTIPEDQVATEKVETEYSDSQKKVAEGLDQATDIVAKQIPGLWGKIKETWSWFMGFETKHFVILLVVILGLIVALAGGGRGGRQKNNG